MKVAAILILAALGSGASNVAHAQQQCPAGSFPWVDTWGNHICRRYSGQSTATAEAPQGQACPTGSYPWTDDRGNKICRSYQTGNQPQTDYYDTSKGCPIGTYEWTDNWGNKVCKRY